MLRRFDCRKTIILSAVSVLALAATAGATQAANFSNDCLKIGAAKFAQWGQARLMVSESSTFADGRMRTDQLVFTHNTVYGEQDGRGWNSLPVLQRQRTAGSAELAAKTMNLIECHEGARSEEAGQPVTEYSFVYAADAAGHSASGKIWIADETGLPVRQELHETAPPANDQVATDISVRYAYNGAVAVPLAAQRADYERRWVARSYLTNLQAGHSAAAQ